MARPASDTTSWREVIDELAQIERSSASPGEQQAAEMIADRLRDLGCRVRIEQERAHGGYWWPLGLANALAGAGAAWALRRRSRAGRARAAAGAQAARALDTHLPDHVPRLGRLGAGSGRRACRLATSARGRAPVRHRHGRRHDGHRAARDSRWPRSRRPSCRSTTTGPPTARRPCTGTRSRTRSPCATASCAAGRARLTFRRNPFVGEP
jgi:hypothetical protein